MTLDDLPIEGKPVTWRYVAGVVVEAVFLLAVGWLMLNAAAALDSHVRAIRPPVTASVGAR